MAPLKCRVHQLGKGDPNKRVVRIRATAFRAFQSKRFIVRITSSKGSERKSAYFEAEYVDTTYRNNISGNDLVFMCESWRILLDVKPSEQGKPPDQVEVEAIPENDSLYVVRSALSDDTNEGRIRILPAPQNEKLRNEIKGKRRIACIKRRDRKDVKPVYSEALYADDFYMDDWKDLWEKKGIVPRDGNILFISEWYRLLLRTDIGEVIEIDPDLLLNSGSPRELWALLYQYPRNHPQAVICTANMIAIIAFGLGVWGIAFAFPGLKDLIGPFWALLGLPVLFIVGLAIIVLGIKGLIRR